MSRRFPLLLILIVAALSQACATPAEPSKLVVLVRHAEAGGEPESDPPLTPEGRERAAALAFTLSDARISTVIVSSLARTRLTAEPLAVARGITPSSVDVAGGIEQHVEAVAEAVRNRPAGEAVLVVGHSNTIPAIIGALGGPAMPDLCHGEFANLFVLELGAAGDARLIRASYGAADAPGAADCERTATVPPPDRYNS